MKLLKLVYIFLVFLADTMICYAGSEPVCSKFDYEEKLLAKTIRLEYTVDDLVKHLTKLETAQKETEANMKELEHELRATKEVLGNMTGAIQELETKGNITEEKTGKTCPANYLHNSILNICWRLEETTEEKTDWWNAQKQCMAEKAQLMIFDNIATIHFIQTYLNQVDAKEVFVGASDTIEEGTFRWLNGETIKDIPWHSGDPDGGKSQNCLAIFKSYDYKFIDAPCNSKRGFLCQIPL